MNEAIFNKLVESFFVNLWAIVLSAIIFYFVFKAAIKNAMRELVRQEVSETIKNYYDNKEHIQD